MLVGKTLQSKTLQIGQLAAAANVNIQTIHYYERRGLIPVPPRRPSGYREYSLDFVTRIRFIKKAQKLGFSLAEIEELLNLRIESMDQCGEIKERVLAKISAIEEKIQSLQQMQHSLADLVSLCDLREPSSECPIIEVLDNKVLSPRLAND